MDKSNLTKTQQTGEAASAFEQRRTGHVPQSVTAVSSDDTLPTTLHAGLSPAEKALAKSPAGALGRSNRRVLRVLVVDDFPEIATTTAMLLRHYGHEVETVGSGQAALSAVKAKPPDVLLLDLGLPDLSG
jgi:PleD family two-component response regulator